MGKIIIVSIVAVLLLFLALSLIRQELKRGHECNELVLLLGFFACFIAGKAIADVKNDISLYKMEKKSAYIEATLEGIKPEARYGATSVGFVRFTEDISDGTLDYLEKYYQDSVLIFKMADNPKKGERMVFEVKVP